MGTRWFGALRETKHAPRQPQEAPNAGEPKAVLLHTAINSWRSWLTTGARRAPIDTRRAQGGDAYLKKVLLGRPSGAADFSSAMARQAIDEAMSELPTQHKQVVKLAYFGGLTNREIAQQLGLTVGGVRRRLKEGLAIVSAHVERGRAIGRRAVHGFVMWLSLRRLGDSAQQSTGPGLDQVLQAGVVAVMTLAATALLVTHHSPAAHPGQPQKAHRSAAVGSAAQELVQAKPTSAATVSIAPTQSVKVTNPLSQAVALPQVPVKVELPQLPIKLPIQAPALPSPSLPELLGA
jgi:RNA polymerase sigma-70 factor, ECF subfamily